MCNYTYLSVPYMCYYLICVHACVTVCVARVLLVTGHFSSSNLHLLYAFHFLTWIFIIFWSPSSNLVVPSSNKRVFMWFLVCHCGQEQENICTYRPSDSIVESKYLHGLNSFKIEIDIHSYIVCINTYITNTFAVLSCAIESSLNSI